MAVEFVVEDGTGLDDATSYMSEVEFRQYWENRGIDYSLGGSPGAPAARRVSEGSGSHRC